MQQALQDNEQKAQEINTKYVQNINRLQKKNDSLLVVIKSHKVSLMLSNQKVLQLEDKVNRLAGRVVKESDTSKQKIAESDSLGTAASVLIAQEVNRDSLCEGEVGALTVLVQQKDTAIGNCEEGYAGMKQVADSALQQEQNALTQLKQLDKKLKRRTAQSRLLSGALLILTGVSATLFLSHYQK